VVLCIDNDTQANFFLKKVHNAKFIGKNEPSVAGVRHDIRN
jgi:hypothetical protein